MSFFKDSGKIRNLEQLYLDRQLYSSSDMFSPPSERRPHVIRFELTQGCDWGKCTFCNGFDGTPFREKTLDEYKHHVDSVWEKIGEKSKLARGLTRFFIGGGNAMAVETKKLVSAIDYTYQKFKENTWNYPTRIALYASIQAITGKEKEDEFDQIKHAGLNMIYIGLESGSENVLRYVNKGCTQKHLDDAIEMINRVYFPTSIMVIPGLGGIKFAEEHTKETIEVLKKIRPHYVTFMGINPRTNSRYAKIMAEEQRNGTNRPLRDSELIQQTAEILKGIRSSVGTIGCFNSNIDSVGYNPAPFGSVESYGDISLAIEKLKKKVKIAKGIETLTDLLKRQLKTIL